VLDLICSLSSEANFVTILYGMDQMSASSKIRRLSIQNVKEDNSMTLATRSMKQVRSIVVLLQDTSLIPVFRSFQVLRVMDLQYCDLSQGYNLKCLGNLFHLRYLGLGSTGIVELPEEIGNLKFLQILDIRGNQIDCLPSNVVQLKHLMCLKIDDSTRVSNGIGSLTSLELLEDISIDDSNIHILEELGQLTELRVLDITLDEWNDKLVECLPKLQKIQGLSLGVPQHQKNIGGLDAWVAPRCLRRLCIQSVCWFSTLPEWMNPSHLPCLSILSIAVREVQQRDLDILGNLHALRELNLVVGHDELGIFGGFVIGAGSFPCLRYCDFRGFVGPIVFQQGAMPRLRALCSGFFVREAIEIGSSDGVVGLDFGLGILPSLQYIFFLLDSEGASEEEVKKLKAKLWHASKIHPNRPRLLIDGCSEDQDE